MAAQHEAKQLEKLLGKKEVLVCNLGGLINLCIATLICRQMHRINRAGHI